MSSSTSSSDDQRWKRCFLGFLASAGILVSVVWLLIVLVDPFDTLHLSLPMDRRPITRNQRYAYPAIARSASFDSAVTGSSTTLLLDPRELDRDLDRRFVNLSLKLGVPHEQYKLLRVFRRHHEHPRTVVISVDNYWIQPDDGTTAPSRLPFPEWMYDTDPWNDYAEQFNFYALRHAPPRLSQSLGGATPRYRADGYERFTPDFSLFDLGKVRLKLYGKRAPTAEEMEVLQRRRPEEAGRGTTFDLATLRDTLALFPAETEKILLLPPLHVVRQLPLAHAKRGLVEAARAFENVRVLDFMFPSEITRTDKNYWDPVHYNVEIATQLSALLAASREAGFESDVCRVLLR